MIHRTTLLALMMILVTGSAVEPVSGPAGVYTVTTTGPTRVTSGDGWVKIQWDVEPSVPAPPPLGPVVTPPPVVTPVPPVVEPPVITTTPGPPPVLTGQVFMLAVYETGKVSGYPPAVQAILLQPGKGGSVTIGPAMKALGISWQPRDINDPALAGEAAVDPQNPAKITTWKGEAEKRGLPCVIAIGQDGQKVAFWVGLMPANENAVVELGKKITGK